MANNTEVVCNIPLWQLKKVENILRLTNNINNCQKKITAYDRMVVESMEFVDEALLKQTK